MSAPSFSQNLFAIQHFRSNGLPLKFMLRSKPFILDVFLRHFSLYPFVKLFKYFCCLIYLCSTLSLVGDVCYELRFLKGDLEVHIYRCVFNYLIFSFAGVINKNIIIIIILNRFSYLWDMMAIQPFIYSKRCFVFPFLFLPEIFLSRSSAEIIDPSWRGCLTPATFHP